MPGRKFNTGDYRMGFNGKENDKEWGGTGVQDYGFRIYNPAIGKFLSVDPLSPDYPFYTPYQFAGNMPIWAIDLDGLEEKKVTIERKLNSSGKISGYVTTLNTAVQRTVTDQGYTFISHKFRKDGNVNNVDDLRGWDIVDVSETQLHTVTINDLNDDNKTIFNRTVVRYTETSILVDKNGGSTVTSSTTFTTYDDYGTSDAKMVGKPVIVDGGSGAGTVDQLASYISKHKIDYGISPIEKEANIKGIYQKGAGAANIGAGIGLRFGIKALTPTDPITKGILLGSAITTFIINSKTENLDRSYGFTTGGGKSKKELITTETTFEQNFGDSKGSPVAGSSSKKERNDNSNSY